MTAAFWALAGFLTGRSLRNAGLPDAVRQQQYAAGAARREQRRAAGTPTFGQWVLVTLVLLTLVGLAVRAFQ